MDGHRQVEAVHQRDVKVILQVKHHHHPPHVQSLVFAWLLAFKVNSASVTGGTPPLGTWIKIKIKLQGNSFQATDKPTLSVLHSTQGPQSPVSQWKSWWGVPVHPVLAQNLTKIRIKDQKSESKIMNPVFPVLAWNLTFFVEDIIKRRVIWPVGSNVVSRATNNHKGFR